MPLRPTLKNHFRELFNGKMEKLTKNLIAYSILHKMFTKMDG